MNKDYIFGARPVIEAIVSGRDIDKVLLQKNLNNELSRELLDTAKKYNIPIQRVPPEKLNRITRKNHQGAICFLSPISFASLDEILDRAYSSGKDPFILVLDRVSDVRNFGAIVRSAECAGVDAILVPEKGSSAVNADAMKTSAGALSYLPVCRTPNLGSSLKFLNESGLRIIGMTEKASQSLYSTTLTGPVAIVMGSEEDGINPDYLRICDELALIPLTGKISSLNVSVAAAVAIFETIRQRQLN